MSIDTSGGQCDFYVLLAAYAANLAKAARQAAGTRTRNAASPTPNSAANNVAASDAELGTYVLAMSNFISSATDGSGLLTSGYLATLKANATARGNSPIVGPAGP
ncbi:MAG: hypothetical protein ABSG31_18170 [Tepidisphaeraceae bacterium]|jgi:hypothetical protein